MATSYLPLGLIWNKEGTMPPPRQKVMQRHRGSCGVARIRGSKNPAKGGHVAGLGRAQLH